MQNKSLYAPIYDQSVMMHEVVFHDDKTGEERHQRYTYKAAIALQVGDTVIMQARGWYQVGTVMKTNVSIPMDDDETRYKWIIGKVSLMDADLLMAWEDGLIDEIHRVRAEGMRQQLMDHIGVQPNQLTTLMSQEDVQDADMQDGEASEVHDQSVVDGTETVEQSRRGSE